MRDLWRKHGLLTLDNKNIKKYTKSGLHSADVVKFIVCLNICLLWNVNIMEFDNNSSQDRQKQQVIRGSTGMGPPPTDLSWPPPPPSPTLLSASAASFVPTSSLLGQARDVLYSQTPYRQSFCQNVPTTYEQNNTMPVDRVNQY